MRDVDKKEKRILDDAITMKKDLDVPSFRCGKEKKCGMLLDHDANVKRQIFLLNLTAKKS